MFRNFKTYMLARWLALGFAFGPAVLAWAGSLIVFVSVRGATGDERSAWAWFGFMGTLVFILAMVLWREISLKLIEARLEEIAKESPQKDDDLSSELPSDWRELQMAATNELGSEGIFFPWENKQQLQTVGTMIRQGKYTLASRQMAGNFSRDEWARFCRTCEEYGYVDVKKNRNGAKTRVLNQTGRENILILAFSPTPNRLGALHNL